MRSNRTFKIDNLSFRPTQLMGMDQEHVTEKKFTIQPGWHCPYSDCYGPDNRRVVVRFRKQPKDFSHFESV